MGSFRVSYDAEEDVLRVTFAQCDEDLKHAIPLNDHIHLYTERGGASISGLTFFSYSQLLGVSETEFTALRERTESQVNAALALLTVPPASLFFDLTDPAGLIARILSPNLERLVTEDETGFE